MKKYITVAALLAAGTAFAGEQITLEDATFAKGGNTGYDTMSGKFSLALTLDATELRNLLENGKTPAWGTEILTYDCAGTLTGVVVNGSSYNNKITTSALYAKWGDGNAWGNWIAGDTKVSSVTNTCSTTTLGDLNGEDNGTGWDNVSKAGLVYTFDSTGGTKVYFQLLGADGSVLVNTYGYASGLKSGSAGVGALKFGDVVATSYYYNEVLSEEKCASLISQVTNAAPIPEPSLFGLFAGLGALVLVGTRRRRR